MWQERKIEIKGIWLSPVTKMIGRKKNVGSNKWERESGE
jgi:hypothetical protein